MAGWKSRGAALTIFAILFGLCLALYAYGIWAMRRFALPVAYIYTAWVIVNMVLYSMKNRSEPHPSLIFTIAATAIGVGVPLATALIRSRRQNDLT